MANNVFANGREFSCKAGSGKSIAAFPDVCMTPPENPATPPGVPVPYPNTGMSSDTTDGSQTVKITGKEVMLKNKSYFKKSMGDEAGAAAKKGVVSSVNRGKVYFTSWSMDVKVEGENAVRHLDMTTHNHGSTTNAPPMVHQDRMALLNNASDKCAGEKTAIDEACGNPLDAEKTKCPDDSAVQKAKAKHRATKRKSPEREAAMEVVNAALSDYALEIREKNACQRALRCALVPYNKAKPEKGKNKGCCPPQTPEHLVPASMFGKGRGKGHKSYSAGKAACMCAEGGAQRATHGLLGHHRYNYLKKTLKVDTSVETSDTITMKQACECGASSARRVMPQCSSACIEAQLKQNHEDMDIKEGDPLRPVQSDDAQSMSQEFIDRFEASAPPPRGP